MKHIERLKRKVLKRPGSPAGTGSETSSPGTEEQRRTEPSQHQKGYNYGLLEFQQGKDPQEPSGSERFPVDIIAVHGLGGDAYKTWTSTSNGALWLRDFVPSLLPGCRVYTFGYPAKLMDVEMRARVQEFGRSLLTSVRDHIESSTEKKRSIIFVCYSLGGIVLKQAFVYAHEDEARYGEVLKLTIGVVFLATPHKGSDTANFANVIFTIFNAFQTVATVGLRPMAGRTDLLEYLCSNSDALQDLSRSALHRLEHLAIESFHENNVTRPSSSIIVDRASASLGVYNENITPLWEDHKTICRFDHDTSQSYLSVAAALKRIAMKSQNIGPTLRRASTHSSNRVFNDLETTCVNLLHDYDQAQYEQQPPSPISGTCEWIRHHSVFTSWLDTGSNALLWLTGNPGCGKTILSWSLAEYLRDVSEKPQTVLIYMCQNKNKQTDAKAILIGLIFQILSRHRSMIDHIRKMFDLHRQSMMQSFNLLWALFLRIIQDPKSGLVYIILDALDECEQASQRQLLASIFAVLSNPRHTSQGGVKFKFLLTSRPFLYKSYIHEEKGLQSQICIDSDQAGYTNDLQKFIRQRVDEISTTRDFSNEMREYLYQSMALKADQTFLWIHIVLTSLEESFLTAKKDLKNIIASIPEGLRDTYKRYLTTLPSVNQHKTSRLLKLLLGSSRPLHPDELNIAFTLESSHITVDDVMQERQASIEHTTQAFLGPLVRVSASQVSLIHQSFKEFLLEQSVEASITFPSLRTVNAQSSARLLATACMQYLLLYEFQTDFFVAEKSLTPSSAQTSEFLNELSIRDFGPDFWDNEESNLDADSLFGGSDTAVSGICETLDLKFAFYNYAALHWAEHFAICEEIASPDLRNAARSLLDVDTACCRNWLHFYNARTVYSLNDDAFNKDHIVLASHFNLNMVLQDLLCEHEPSQATKNRSLHWAALLGHDAILSTLIRIGADANARELERQTALTTAAEHGNLACIVKLLAHKPTNINMPGRGGRTALSFACGGGYEDIVSELLKEQSCQEDKPDHSGATPFFWAVGGGHKSTVFKLARRSSIDINHADKKGRTATSWAAGDGTADILAKLLKLPGIDANLQDKKGRSPLSWAVGNGQIDTVEVLLGNKTVDRASIDNDNRTTISWACAGGQDKILVKLLEKKVPGIDEQDIDGWTPLMWAIQTNAPETVQLLIDSKEVQLEQRDLGGRTALFWAVEYRQARVVDVLLRAGANPEARNNWGATPMSLASKLPKTDPITEMLASRSLVTSSTT